MSNDPDPDLSGPDDALDAAPFEADVGDAWDSPERVSLVWRQRASDFPPETFVGKALDAIARVTSAMLRGGDWTEPFHPVFVMDGRRTDVPSDLDAADLSALSHALPHLTHVPTRARVADALWAYADRSDVELLRTAVDAYMATPLEPSAWFGYGQEAWRRALQLAGRRGKGEQERLELMQTALLETIMASTDSGFFVVQVAELLRETRRAPKEQALDVARHLAEEATKAASKDTRLARALEEGAAHWFLIAHDEQSANDAMLRIARLFEAEADKRLAEGESGAMAAGVFFEDALKIMRMLPRKYRLTHGLDEKIAALRARLHESRLETLDHMQRLDSDPIDVFDAVADARVKVAGKEKLEALGILTLLWSWRGATDARQLAENLLSDSISRIFGRMTLGADGRKLAADPGGSGTPSAAEIEGRARRDFRYHVNVGVQARILPAVELVRFEHDYEIGYLVALCRESPTVPEGHETLWALGLRHGLAGDYASAAAVLAPQMEQFVRHHLKLGGVYTLYVEPETGIESEKSLNSLLDMTEAVAIFGADLVLEMQSLLITKDGLNLRNDVAHGLFNDAQGFSSAAIYLWWVCLRLAVIPVYQARASQRNGNNERSDTTDSMRS